MHLQKIKKPHSAYIFNQDGDVITQRMIALEKTTLNRQYLESKRAEFEKALEARCIDTDEPYSVIGFHAEANMTLYQVGMNVYGIQCNQDGLSPVMVGKVG